VDQGAGNGNRRRRRRRPEVPAKDETPPKIFPNLPDLNKDIGAEAEVEAVAEESPGREKIIRRPDAERVSVEMTPLEQDVYALMGVSPLVRLDRQFKDPKSVILSIRSPGEPEVIAPTSEKVTPLPRKEIPMASNELSTVITKETEFENELIDTIEENSTNFFNYEPETTPTEAELVLPEISTDVTEFEPIHETEEEKEEIGQSLNRRRRRRSSAQES